MLIKVSKCFNTTLSLCKAILQGKENTKRKPYKHTKYYFYLQPVVVAVIDFNFSFLQYPPPPPSTIMGFLSPDNMKPKNPLTEMEKKAKRIKKIQVIANTILANGCYHSKEMENQLMMAEKNGNITVEEEEIIKEAWQLRSSLAHELMKELKRYIDENREIRR